MAEYLVTWTVEVEADSPLAAAELAREIQRDPASTATSFEVCGKHGERREVFELD